MKKQIGIQLYSVRDELGKDFGGVISKIAAMGYAGVELAGLPAGITAETARRILKDNGLKIAGAHSGLPAGDNRQKAIDNMLALGCKILVSGKGPDCFKTEDLLRQSCEEFNKAAATLKPHGIRFAIHNHWWEFQNLGSKPVYKLMAEALDPSVLFEIDTYWVKTAGADPVAVVRELGKRAPLLHIKDGPCKIGEHMTAVGKGTMDFPPILKAAGAAEWLIVELDSCATDMMDAVRESREYLGTL